MATIPLPISCSNNYSLNFPSSLSRYRKSLFLCPSIPSSIFHSTPKSSTYYHYLPTNSAHTVKCKAAEVSVAEASSVAGDNGGSGNKAWIPVVPLAALPKGERRVIIQDGETILLLWYKDQVLASENRSPAEGAYREGLLNAKLTQDGCIVCPTTDSTFDLRTGAIKDWYPKNPVLRPPLRSLFIYPVKTDEENIYISMSSGLRSDAWPR